MISLRRRQQGMTIVLWLVSMLIPFSGRLSVRSSLRETEVTEGSIPWLSLPLGMGGHPDPAGGWWELARPGRELSSDEIPIPALPLPEPVKDTGPPETLPDRIQLCGMISEGDTVVYCFYDSSTGHWFSLATGEQDSLARVQLLDGDSAGLVHLVNLENGKHFRIQPEEWKLYPLGTSAEMSREKFE